MSKVILQARPVVKFEYLCNNFLRYCKSNGYPVVVTGSGFIYQNVGEIKFSHKDDSLTIVGDEIGIHSIIDEIGGVTHILKYFDVMYDRDACVDPVRIGDDPEMYIYDLHARKLKLMNITNSIEDINLTRSRGYKASRDESPMKASVRDAIEQYEEEITTFNFSTLGSSRPVQANGLEMMYKTFGGKK